MVLPDNPHPTVLACPDCDLLNRVALQEKEDLCCQRCGALLYKSRSNSIDRALALTITSLLLFVVSNSFPFLVLKSGGRIHETILLSGIYELWREGRGPVSLLVFFTCVFLPFIQMLGLVYILAPLKWARQPAPLAIYITRLIQGVVPWCMMEVFMIGILVALVKLKHIATITLGTSVISFGILIFIMTAVISSLDLQLLWNRLDLRR
jgi:paraquat-inducible protein A